MNRLHIVSKTPHAHDALASCIAHALAEDGILLIADGVYAALKNNEFAKSLRHASDKGIALYVLTPDLALRGLNADDLMDDVSPADYSLFVTLASCYNATQSWF